MVEGNNIQCVVEAVHEVMCNGTKYIIGEEKLTPHTKMFWVYLGVYVALVLVAGLMSGLTMGLLSLDVTSLEILCKSGKPKEQKFAKKILPIVKRHHLLLVTLLLANAAAVESMPLFMDRISDPVIAICVSVTAVLLFGEIIPQAICTRYGLAIGAFLSPFVKLLMFLLFIIAWPISKLLDCLLGVNHATFFRRAELKELVSMHGEEGDRNEDPLSIDEVLIIKGALDLRDKSAKDAYVPLEYVYMVEASALLDRATMKDIIGAGHSRVPIYEGNKSNIIGVVIVKTIIMLDPDDAVCIRNVMRTLQVKVSVTEPLYNLLNTFQTGKSHMALVKDFTNDEMDNKEVTIGIITLEDVIEELIQEEIVDETDVFIDVHKRIQVARARLNFHRSYDGRVLARTSPLPSKRNPNTETVPAVIVGGGALGYDERKPLLD